MRPEDLDLLRACASPAVTPDGRTAIVSVLRPDTATDEYVGSLWRVRLGGHDTSGGHEQDEDAATHVERLTRGHRDTSPQISPDGRWVAFVRAERKGKPQLHVVPVAGGEAVRLTDHPLGAGAPRWSPDSRRIAYTARVPEEGRYGTDPDVTSDAEPPRLITSLAYRMDGLGYTNDRRQHIFVLDLGSVDLANADGTDLANKLEPVQLTDGDCDNGSPVWSPDGELIAFTSDRRDGQTEDLRSQVFVAPASGGDPRQVSSGDLSVNEVSFAPDGSRLFFVATEVGASGLDFVARNAGLHVVGADGQGQRRLTDAETIDLGEAGSHMTVTSRGVLVQDRVRGAVRLLEIDPDAEPVDGNTAVEIFGGERVVRQHAATADGDVVVAVVADPERAGDLYIVRENGSTAERRVTDLSEGLREKGIRPLREVTVTADDGYPVHGWAVLPDPERFGDGPYPVLLNIHGGPYAAYGWGLFDEAQVYAGAGYAVLMCNPRGSAGYGESHGRAIQGAFGDRDAADVLQFLDGALADQSLALDGDRVGVMGGSYGGYMTAWLTTQTDRFVAAIVERGYLDASTFVGSSDIGWFFPQGYHGDMDTMRQQAPLTYVDKVVTPTFVIHSEADWRTPLEQGQRWYTALKLAGVETELLVFPGEGHELSRSGRPRHRRARFEHILRWWDRYLPTTPIA
jgi:dipeptidyl aminopeptidase/acylaminoacyl peptidase